jgi:hypothetical protein
LAAGGGNVAASELTGDDKLDLVFVYSGNGNGTFGAVTVFNRSFGLKPKP